MVYQLVYELKSSDFDYTQLFSFLENNWGDKAIHVLRDCWWIASDSDLDVDATCKQIRGFMGPADNMYVAKMPIMEINGWLPSSLWTWYTANK